MDPAKGPGYSIDILVKVTLLVILAFSTINLVANVVLYSSTRKPIYLRLGLFWAFLVLNFGVQYLVREASEFWIISSFVFVIIPALFLAHASVEFTGQRFPLKTFLAVGAAAILMTVVLDFFPLPFYARAIPIAWVSASIMWYGFYVLMIKEGNHSSRLIKLHSLVLLFGGLHMSNFPFLRMDPSAEVYAWPIAYVLGQALATLLPAVTLDYYRRQEESRLKSIIDEKTRDLVQTNKQLRQSVAEKQFLFRTLSHDISSPLTILQGHIELYRRTNDATKLVASVATITDRIAKLIQQVKTYEANQKGSANIEVTGVALEGCVREVAGLYENSLKAKALRLSLDFDPNAETMALVERNSFIGSVLSNLLNNAIKFSYPTGHITIRIETPSDHLCRLTVRDDGMGIPAAMLPTIFDFDQPKTRIGTGGESGTGYGLPIVKKIVESYSGQVSIRSEEQIDSSTGFTEIILDLERHYPASKTASAIV